MDLRERMDDGEEMLRSALDAGAAELWTSLPGIVHSFDPAACTAVIQPAIQGSVTGQDGAARGVTMPLLPDVPVIFPHSKDFALTFPIKPGDECMVWFAARCIDAWWQSGGVQPALDPRMHDLSDAFCLVGPWSQAGKIDGISAENVQLRTTDGAAFVEIAPDLTITAKNPGAGIVLDPAGKLSATATAEISLAAPVITIAGNLNWTGYGGGAGSYAIAGELDLDGPLHTTGNVDSDADVTAQTISLTGHVHTGVMPGGGDTGTPKA